MHIKNFFIFHLKNLKAKFFLVIYLHKTCNPGPSHYKHIQYVDLFSQFWLDPRKVWMPCFPLPALHHPMLKKCQIMARKVLYFTKKYAVNNLSIQQMVDHFLPHSMHIQFALIFQRGYKFIKVRESNREVNKLETSLKKKKTGIKIFKTHLNVVSENP